jgi:hypothetical protein
VVVISGVAGIGKTTVWEAALARAHGFRALVARPAGSESQLAYSALGFALRRLDRLDPAARAGVLARLNSTLGQLAPQDFAWEGEVICAVACAS